MVLKWFIYRISVIICRISYHYVFALKWIDLSVSISNIYLSRIYVMVHSNMFTSEMCEFGVHSVIKKISDISS